MSLCRLSPRNKRVLSIITTPEAHQWLRSGFSRKYRNTSYGGLSDDSVYTSTPIYPQIMDLSKDSVGKRDRDYKLDKLKKVGTIEEKLIGINMPRYYGWSSLMLYEGNYPLNFMPFVQHITRTHYIEVDRFPFTNNNRPSVSEVQSAVDRIRPQLQDALILEISKRRHCHVENGSAERMGERELSDEITKGVVEQINRVLCANLAQLAPHLYDTEVDYEPRLEAFWRVGGFHPDQATYDERLKDKEDHQKALKTNRFAKRKLEEEPEDAVGHFIQYLGRPVLQLRHQHPPRALETPLPAPTLSKVPVVKYDPGFYGLEKIRRHGTNIPGYWPGDPYAFGLMSFHSRGHLLGRPPSFGERDEVDTVSAQAILASYAWLLAQACYQGFSTFHELTYPLSTTTVVTDGRVFSLFASQLNTVLTHDEFIDINPLVNVCYGLPTLELFQEVRGEEILGWDDRVVALLVEAYLNAPAAREGLEIQPYVDKAAPLVQDIDNEERRVWLHKNYRHFYANKPRYRLDLEPELYNWENIYKVKFETRPMDARRRFFELGVDPWKRRLDDRSKNYIPRKFRDPDNYKKKFYDTFWPDC